MTSPNEARRSIERIVLSTQKTKARHWMLAAIALMLAAVGLAVEALIRSSGKTIGLAALVMLTAIRFLIRARDAKRAASVEPKILGVVDILIDNNGKQVVTLPDSKEHS